MLKAGDLIEDMVEFSWHAEEPRVGSSLPTYCTSRLASRFTKVCLSGTGGDEVFGGYPWRYQAALTSGSRDEFAAKYFSFWHRMVKPELFSGLTSPIGSSFDPFEVFRNKLFTGSRPGEAQPSFINQALIFEITTFLHGLLVVEDKASMAHGLEVRVPLLDNELIDLALSLPLEDKITTAMQPKGSVIAYGSGSGSAPSFTNGKIALRKALAGHVPDEVAHGRKQGFSPPFESWFRGPMRPYLDTHVFGPHSSLGEYLDMDIARVIWEEHADKGINNRLFVWGMLALQLFLDHFMKRATE